MAKSLQHSVTGKWATADGKLTSTAKKAFAGSARGIGELKRTMTAEGSKIGPKDLKMVDSPPEAEAAFKAAKEKAAKAAAKEKAAAKKARRSTPAGV